LSGSNEDDLLNRSISRKLASGDIRSWASRDDYTEWFRKAHNIDLAAHPEYAGTVVFDWIRRGQTGCRFAAVLAARRADAKWASAVFPRPIDSRELESHFNALLNGAEGVAEALQVVFPYVEDYASLVGLVNDICRSPQWYWESIFNPTDDSVLLGLRWKLSDDRVVWVVGFAPFEEMPFTRRAPYTTLEIRTDRQKRSNYDLGDDTVPAHLADIDDLLPSDEVRRALDESTRAAKADLLDGEYTDAARARVTFRIPAEYATALLPCEDDTTT